MDKQGWNIFLDMLYKSINHGYDESVYYIIFRVYQYFNIY